MRKLFLGLALAFWATSASAQTQCLVPVAGPATPVVSAAAEGSHILKASPGCLLATYVTIGSTAGYLMIFNSTTVPADGAVAPVECIQVAATTTGWENWAPLPPEYFSLGIVAVFSTTGCFTKTIGSGVFFHGIVQ